ncbi:MAG TPA: hypothetical protein VFF76_03300 [Holophagaceae bacterium]|jgi:hypothetical protein|nr:hypothetical protein [Holophagaceae bacterium]
MTPKLLRRLDAVAAALLWMWVGAGLGFGILTAPGLFRIMPSRDLAGQVAGNAVGNLDLAAWAVFGAALLLVYAGRWLAGVDDEAPIGPIRLWTAACLAALVICLASSFIVTPKLREIRARMSAPVESLPATDPDRAAYDKAHGASRQFFFLRLLLAAGLAMTLVRLPVEREEKP